MTVIIIAGKFDRGKILQRDDAGDQDPATSIETGQTRIDIMIKDTADEIQS